MYKYLNNIYNYKIIVEIFLIIMLFSVTLYYQSKEKVLLYCGVMKF